MTATPAPLSADRRDDLTTPWVRMGEPEAERVAAQHYDLVGSATRLHTEKDDTFRIDCPDGERVILKVANPVEQLVELDLQVSLVEHVASRNLDVPVPAVIRDRRGQALTEITDAAGQERMARVLSFIPGVPLDSVRSSRPQRLEVGRLLGRVRRATEDFDHPGALRVLAWDVQNLLGLKDLLAAIPDQARRADLQRGLERFERRASELWTLRKQVLHNDFSKSNLLADKDDPDRLVGVIDFGDAVRTAIVIDVSTALLNQLPRSIGSLDEDVFADGRDVLAGYLEVSDLTAQELKLLPHLVMSRVVARALITHHRASLFPDNARYIMRNTEPGWGQLRWFLSRSEAEVSATFSDFMSS